MTIGYFTCLESLILEAYISFFRTIDITYQCVTICVGKTKEIPTPCNTSRHHRICIFIKRLKCHISEMVADTIPMDCQGFTLQILNEVTLQLLNEVSSFLDACGVTCNRSHSSCELPHETTVEARRWKHLPNSSFNHNLQYIRTCEPQWPGCMEHTHQEMPPYRSKQHY